MQRPCTLEWILARRDSMNNVYHVWHGRTPSLRWERSSRKDGPMTRAIVATQQHASAITLPEQTTTTYTMVQRDHRVNISAFDPWRLRLVAFLYLAVLQCELRNSPLGFFYDQSIVNCQFHQTRKRHPTVGYEHVMGYHVAVHERTSTAVTKIWALGIAHDDRLQKVVQ